MSERGKAPERCAKKNLPANRHIKAGQELPSPRYLPVFCCPRCALDLRRQPCLENHAKLAPPRSVHSFCNMHRLAIQQRVWNDAKGVQSFVPKGDRHERATYLLHLTQCLLADTILLKIGLRHRDHLVHDPFEDVSLCFSISIFVCSRAEQ